MEAVKAIIMVNKKLLILKRTPFYLRKTIPSKYKDYLDKDKDDLWDLPGGGIKKKETKIQALKREVKEETNLDVNVLERHNKWSFITLKGNERKVNNYLCEVLGDVKKIKLSDEHSEYKWINLKEVRKYKFKNESFYLSLKDLID